MYRRQRWKEMGTRAMLPVFIPLQVTRGMKEMPMPARISSRTVSGLSLSRITVGSKPAIRQYRSVMVRRLFPRCRQMNSSPATSRRSMLSFRARGVGLGQRQEDLLLDEGSLVLPGAGLDGGKEGEVAAAVPPGAQVLLDDAQADGGVLPLEAHHQLGQQLGGGVKGDGDAAAVPFQGVVQLPADVLHLLEDPPGVAQHHLPVFIEADVLPGPLEQLHPQLRLQAGDGAAQGGLGHMELLRRPGDVLQLCRLLEIGQGVDVHCCPSFHNKKDMYM